MRDIYQRHGKRGVLFVRRSCRTLGAATTLATIDSEPFAQCAFPVLDCKTHVCRVGILFANTHPPCCPSPPGLVNTCEGLRRPGSLVFRWLRRSLKIPAQDGIRGTLIVRPDTVILEFINLILKQPFTILCLSVMKAAGGCCNVDIRLSLKEPTSLSFGDFLDRP